MCFVRLFIAFQWVGISVQFGTAAIIPDVPDCVDIQQRRNEFIVSKLIDQTKDENYGNVRTLLHAIVCCDVLIVVWFYYRKMVKPRLQILLSVDVVVYL